MIDYRVFCDLYNMNVVKRIETITEKLNLYTSKKDKLKCLIEGKSELIDSYLNVTLDEVLNNHKESFLDKIQYPITPVYYKGKEVSFEGLTLYIKKYIWVNNLVKTFTRELLNLQNQVIDQALYYEILKDFNDLIIDKIINTNYYFEMGSRCGDIFVIKNYNERKRVNWGQSNINKKAIIDRGGIPYVKADAEVTENYKGEMYLAYHPTTDYFLHWSQSYSNKKYNPRTGNYRYLPARGKKSIVTKLLAVKKDRARAEKLYNRTLN